jgi:hypothetical protein
MHNRLALLLTLLVVLGVPGTALALDAKVQAMGDRFVAAVPADWRGERGSWSYLDVEACFTTGTTCYGSNPSSPYGFPDFGTGMDFRMAPNEAVVVFMRTPPEMRYYAFTQYLFSRSTSSKPFLFASMSDSLNMRRMRTLRSSAVGTDLFDQYAVLVWTADLNTLAGVKALLGRQKIADSEVNFVPMPYELPLFMGQGEADDTFTLLMRTALPTAQSQLDAYIDESPFYVVRVAPLASRPVNPAPIIGFAEEVTGVAEEASLANALAALVADIEAHYAGRFSFTSPRVVYSPRVGRDCMADEADCPGGDNHDALYSKDLPSALSLRKLTDVVIVAGVNHQRTGKADYVNHAVVDPLKTTGIVAIDDPLLTRQSALFHAGVTSPRDPRVRAYDKLYAYAISYDCSGLGFCMQIPAPTTENPIGLGPGAPFELWGRSYVEPRSGVRPDPSEVVRHRVLVGTSP